MGTLEVNINALTRQHEFQHGLSRHNFILFTRLVIGRFRSDRRLFAWKQDVQQNQQHNQRQRCQG